MSKQDNSPTNDSPDAASKAKKDLVKVPKWVVVQNEILTKIRDATGAKPDNSLTLHHAPQVVNKVELSGNVNCMLHFPCTTGEMFTCQASPSSREHRTLAWKLSQDNTIKSYNVMCPIRITQLIFIPQCRVYVGYSPTKVLRVFMDPETGFQEVFTIPCISVLTCMAFNKETEEIVAGGKGFVETWKISGKEYRTSLQKGKKLELTISKDAEVTELKVDSKNSQVFIVSEKGMCVINYRTSKQTHIMVNRHSGKLCRCCIYHDGEYLVTGSTDGAIKIWNSVVYTQVHEFPGHSGPVIALEGHRKDPLLFSASSDGSVFVWRLDNFQKYMTLDLGAKVMSLKMLSDHTLYCQTDTSITVYTLNQFHRLFAPFEAPVLKLQRLRCFGNHPNRIIVGTEDGYVQMVSPVTGTTITSMSPLPSSPILNTFVYNSKEHSLYTILPDGEVVVFNTTRHPVRASEILEPPMQNKKVNALAVMRVKAGSLDREMEDTLIFMGMKNGQISILESYGMIMEEQVDAHQGELTCLTSSAEVDSTGMGCLPTSRFLVSGGTDNFIKIWGLEFAWEEEEENYNVTLVLVQTIDCSGTPSQVAMMENVVCVALGAYGVTKMYRLGGLRSDLQNQGAIGLAVALTHNSIYDHSDEVMSLDMCPPVRLFLTCSKDGFVKVWDSDNQPVREMNFGRPIMAACFANNRGDIVIGLLNRIILVPVGNYLPHEQLERLAQRMFKDDEEERPIPYKAVKNRRKHWFDRKSLPKFSTDLQKRISEKVQMHSDLFSDMMDGNTLDRMSTNLSLLTDVSNLSDLEGDAEQFNNARATETGSVASVPSLPSEGPSKARRRTRASLSLGTSNFGKLQEEAEEEELPPLQRRPSLANSMRKRSRWDNITPRVLKDLELAAKRKRLSVVSTMPPEPDLKKEEEEKKKKEEEEKALAEKKEKEKREAELVKSLPPWEQFLMKRKPIIALDGYVPNSVVRATIGFVKPKSPEPEWRLKPVPKVNPKHLPEGWKMKSDDDTPLKLRRESTFIEKNMDIKSVMSLKRESTLQSIKQQRSIKDAEMYVGTIYCLLPDGTEPESVPNFQWYTPKEEVADLTRAVRAKSETPTQKQTTVITAKPQKIDAQKNKDSPAAPPAPAHQSTRKIAQKNVSIDMAANMDLRVSSRPKHQTEPPMQKKEKSLSFRLPTAGTANAALVEEPAEEEKEQAEERQAERKTSQDLYGDKPKTAGSQGRPGRGMSGQSGHSGPDQPGREQSMDRGSLPSQGGRTGLLKTPGKVSMKRELTEKELGLLQKIVREEWFPNGVAPAFEPVFNALLDFVDKGEVMNYNKVCDYIVAIAKEIGIPQRPLNRCGDKLTKQSSSTAALVRKKSLWTLRQLGINRKDLISALLPSLSDAKEDIRMEAIEALDELMGEQGEQGLADLMTSLGMSKPLATKEDRKAALKVLSETLAASDKKGGKKGAGGADVKERIQMFVSSLGASDPTSSYETKAAEIQKASGRWDTMIPGASRGSRASLNFSDFDDDLSEDQEDFRTTKSGRLRKASRRRRGKSSKTGPASEYDSPSDEPANRKGENVKGAKRVEMGTEMSPEGNEGEAGRAAEGRRGRGKRQPGGAHPLGGMRAEDEYLYRRYQHYGSDFGDDEEEEEDIYGSRAQFIPIDQEFTPTMFRSDTGESLFSEDNLPNLLKSSENSDKRPRGASIKKFYSRQEQATAAGNQTDRTRRRRSQTLDPMKLGDGDSDVHSLSQYDTDLEAGTQRTMDGTDIMSMADSGIMQDMSDVSSHVRAGLYKQYRYGQPGHPRLPGHPGHPGDPNYQGLSPINSQSQIADTETTSTVKPKKEPDWRDFFEMSTTAEKKRAVKSKKAEKEKEKEAGKEGKVVFASNNLPPITYINTEQPTTAGEVGMRCLHSIRVADKDKTEAEKLKIESVPGRLSMHTQDQSAGETSYGLLQMTWTTNVPALPILPETRGIEAMVPKDIMQPWDNSGLPRLMQPWDNSGVPRLMQPGLWTQQNAESLMSELQKKLPTFKNDRGQDFQWKKPLPPAKVASHEPVAVRHQCDHLRLAKKKMHHFVSGKNRRLPSDAPQSLLTDSGSQHLLSMIRQSSMSFLPPAPLQDVIRHMVVNTEINAG